MNQKVVAEVVYKDQKDQVDYFKEAEARSLKEIDHLREAAISFYKEKKHPYVLLGEMAKLFEKELVLSAMSCFKIEETRKMFVIRVLNVLYADVIRQMSTM